jgi:hypothetical protein
MEVVMGNWLIGCGALGLMLVAQGCARDALDGDPQDPGMQSSALSACSFSAPEGEPGRNVLSVVVGRDLMVVRADGTHTTAYQFGADDPSAASATSSALESRGGFLAAAGYVFDDQSSFLFAEAVLFDVTGALVWRTTSDVVELHLGESGALAVSTKTGTTLRTSDGAVRALPAIYAQAGPSTDGTFPALQYAGDAEEVGWIVGGNPGLQPFAYAYDKGSFTPQLIAGRWTYLGSDGGRTLLVREKPGDARTLDLSAALGPTVSLQTWSFYGESGWLLMKDAASQFWRVDVVNATTAPFEPSMPAGLRSFSPGASGLDSLEFDPDGSFRVPLRDDYSGRLYHSTDGAAWSGVGATSSDIALLVSLSLGGSYLISGLLPESYLPPDQALKKLGWMAPPPGLAPDIVGAARQMVRPVDGVQIVLSNAGSTPSFTDDGTCAATWEIGDLETLAAYDLRSGTRFELITVDNRTSGGIGGAAWWQ